MAQPNQTVCLLCLIEMIEDKWKRSHDASSTRTVVSNEEEELSFQERIFNMLRMPAVEAFICVLLALPVTIYLTDF